MEPSQYLARLAAVRALYRLLYTEAMARLAAAPTGFPEPIECRLAAYSLATQLGVAPSTLREDLRRLHNHRWIDGRLLGHRQGDEVYLIADHEAALATGSQRLVSRLVLGLEQERAAPTPTENAAGRGTSREWREENA